MNEDIKTKRSIENDNPLISVLDLKKKVGSLLNIKIFGSVSLFIKFTDEHLCSNNYKEPLNAFILDGGSYQFYQLHQDYCDYRYIPEFS